MKVKLGDRTQFYGESSDPAMASHVQVIAFRSLEKAGLNLTPVSTGVRGPDVWFEIADDLILDVEQVAITLPEIGSVSRKQDETMGEYLDLPLIFEKREPRRRR